MGLEGGGGGGLCGRIIAEGERGGGILSKPFVTAC